MKKFRLGQLLRDTITGYEGVATARVEYINGCVRYQLERLNKEESVEELFFDEQRLELIAKKREAIVPEKTGGSRSAPPRTGARK